MTRCFVMWLWLLSGLPIGVALVFLPSPARFLCFTVFVVLETAHSLSPIVLAWTHHEFRKKVIYANTKKYILWPLIIFGLSGWVGAWTSAGVTSYVPGPGQYMHITDLGNPFPILVWIYSACNLYHFGMQNFGVLRLAGSRRNYWLDVIIGAGGTVAAYLFLPRLIHAPWLALVMTGAVSVNHWVVDISLSTRVIGHAWWFVISILTVGMVGFLWAIPTPNGMMVRMIPALVCARLGLGFVHFLYSRWVWKLSDPQVRATIGRELFA